MHTQQDEPCGSAKIRSCPQVLQVGQGRIQNKTKGGGYRGVLAISGHDHLGPGDLGPHFCDLDPIW